MRFVLILIALAVYFGGGWIFKDIAFSMIEFSGDTTMGDLLFYACCVYSAITVLVCMLFAPDDDAYFVPFVIVA